MQQSVRATRGLVSCRTFSVVSIGEDQPQPLAPATSANRVDGDENEDDTRSREDEHGHLELLPKL